MQLGKFFLDKGFIMRVQNHIAFRVESLPQLYEYLVKNNIPFSQGKIISTVDVDSCSPHWNNIEMILSKGNVRYSSETLYTKTELANAEWLTMRSQWRYGFPQPESTQAYKEFSYSGSNFCPICGSGIKQTKQFRIKKVPNWGNKHFMMLNWVEDELFVDECARALLIESGFSGFTFQNVFDKNADKDLVNIYQLMIKNELEPGLISDRPAIDLISRCPSCGVSKYHPTGVGMLAMRKQVFEGASDVMKTSEIFGWGSSAAHRIVVSKNVYLLLTKHNLSRGLVFEPIELV